MLRGKDDTGKDLIIALDYIAEGLHHRASELATEWLGPRTELDIQHNMAREVDQERWTGLDRTLQRKAVDGLVRAERLAEPRCSASAWSSAGLQPRAWPTSCTTRAI